MPLQNFLKIITNRWVVFTVITWSILIFTASSVLTYYHKKEALNNEAIHIIAEIETLTKKKENLDTEKEQLNLEDKKLSAILSDLLSASKQSGTRLGETVVAELSVQDNFQSLPVMISVKGNYNQIGRFVNLVEKNIKFKLQEVNLSTKETKGVGIICKIKAEYIIL